MQEADANGQVTFTSIFPAALLGPLAAHPLRGLPRASPRRPPAGNKLATSQLALPEDDCNAVYATDGYEQSVRNLAQTSLESDIVFSDGVTQQLATMTGDVEHGFVATLTVGV